MPKQNIHLALFDVLPKKDSEGFRAGKVVNLKRKEERKEERREERTEEIKEEIKVEEPRVSVADQIARHGPVADSREIIAHDIESALKESNLVADLARMGAKIHQPRPTERSFGQAQPKVSTRPRAIERPIPEPPLPVKIPNEPDEHKELTDFWTAPASQQSEPTATLARMPHAPFEPRPHRPIAPLHLSPAARDVEHWLQQVKTRKRQTLPRRIFTRRSMVAMVVGFLAITGVAAAAFVSSELVVQKEAQVLGNSNNAIANLEAAKTELEGLNFIGAADRFALAYEDFGKASGTINNFGASFLSFLPGLGKVKSAQNLVQAGQYISKAGESLSRAFDNLHTINFFAEQSIASPIEDFQDVLKFADQNISKAGKLLNGVETSAIPEEKRSTFEHFRKQVPSFQAYIGQALEYTDFLLGFFGKRSPKTYMVLLQNTSERRPTGGFPGTYAIISFDKGMLKKVFVDDIYNPDGQIKVNMIPPVPLRHITPNWGLRDVNWFADFPTSARKITEYYQYDGGAALDGVFAITPTLIARLLEVIGPIEMPEYGVTLDAKNFLAEIQDEVEYGENRIQPKKIVIDFQAIFFEKLAEQKDKDTWVAIMKIFVDALQEKHILAYVADQALQEEVLENGLAGQLKKTDGDYLQVAISNVKGVKADAVTANSMKLSVADSTHVLTITRAHNGGDSKYPFYNKENFSYIKVYVPKGSQFVHAEGFSKTNYKPLVNYKDLGFNEDPDLAAVERTMTHPVEGIDVFEESGKTVFGFWLNTKPKKVNTMTLAYETPVPGTDRYDLLWQKQSGSEGDQMHVSITPPSPLAVRGETEGIQIIGNTAVYDNDLSLDREVKVVFN
ncbi:MAG: DUF4012 domain-containing protein [Patescibacteria group bacterium]